MPCEERDRLLNLLLASLKVQGNAFQAVTECKGEGLKRARKMAAIARQTCRDCRQVLAAHERSHGCAPKPPKP
jgi:NAD(P)H-nitrite reductase large subunit